MIQPRTLALQILYDIEVHTAYVNISFQTHTETAGLDGRDTAFAKELVYGVTKHKLTLDAVIAHCSSVKLKKLAPYVLCILRMGLYQLFYMDKVPNSAAVNESVKLAAKYAGRSRGFVNAVLRRAAREGLQLPEGESAEALSVRYSYPLPLVYWFTTQFGEKEGAALLAAGNQTPPLCIRVNPLKTTREALQARLAEEGIEARCAAWCDTALLLSGGHVQQSAAYREGLFTIQDQSAQLAALALSAQPGDCVFDVCAAPGGKTTQLAEQMENSGTVYAWDLYEKRLNSVQNTAKRLGISIIQTQTADARTVLFPKQADKILADVPCSGLGVVRRRPDLKYKDALTEFAALTETQLAILCHAADALKPGGVLVYSTCTVNPAENEGVIHSFLEIHPDFAVGPIDNPHITGAAAKTLQSGMGTLYPTEEGGDGFFICRLTKRADTE